MCPSILKLTLTEAMSAKRCQSFFLAHGLHLRIAVSYAAVLTITMLSLTMLNATIRDDGRLRFSFSK